jgi:hypothetical protein
MVCSSTLLKFCTREEGKWEERHCWLEFEHENKWKNHNSYEVPRNMISKSLVEDATIRDEARKVRQGGAVACKIIGAGYIATFR